MSKKKSKTKTVKKQIGTNVFAKPPKISVIIPAYKSADYICETLESVIGQKFRDFEIIVVNDGSPDTVEFERAIANYLKEIVYIKQPNAGAGAARNTGVENARADIIAFLDSDDVWLPDFLSSQLVFLERNDFDMVYCDAAMFGMRSAYRKNYMDTAPSTGAANFESILDFRCNVITSGTMVKKQTVIEAGMFETERVRAHDFHLWLRIAKNGAKIGYQRKQLLKYRVRVDSLSGDSISRVERELDAFERVRRTIELTDKQEQIVERRIAGLEADLAVEQGKVFLLDGDFPEAAVAFRVANRHRKSLKLTVILWLTKLAPKAFLKFYAVRRSAEIEFVPQKN